MSATFYDLGERILAVCPKAGSQSIRKALLTDLGVREIQMHGIKNTPSRQGKGVIWFVRNPLERVRSAWRYFEHTVGWPKETNIKQADYQTFVDLLLDGASNRHWDSQTPMVTYTRFFLPTEIYPFEQIGQLWDSVVGKGTLTHQNESAKIDTDTYREDDLIRHFADDYRHWSESQTFQPHNVNKYAY